CRCAGRRAGGGRGARAADAMLELAHEPLREALADAPHATKSLRVAAFERPDELGWRKGGQRAERDRRSDTRHADQPIEERALVLASEAVEPQAFIADDQPSVETDLVSFGQS